MHPQDMRRYFFLPKFIEIFMETPCWHHGRTWSIHVQYTQTESIRLRHFTIWLDLHVTSQLDSHWVASRKSTSGMTNRQQEKPFVSIRSNRFESTTFSTTLYSSPEVKIHEITIHEPSSFLKHGHKLQSIRVDSIESNRQHFQPTLKVQINY